MIRKTTAQAFRRIKERVRDNAFGFTNAVMESMLDLMVYEEDVKRAVSTGRLAAWYMDDRSRTCYVLRGFGMDEDPLTVVCRMPRTRVIVTAVFRA